MPISTWAKSAINSPVANLVGVGERGARNSTSETHVIELGLLSAQTGFDVAQTGAIGELSKSQTEELIPAREIFDVTIALVAIDAKLKLVARNELHELSENRLAEVHRLPPKQSGKQSYGAIKQARKLKSKSKPQVNRKSFSGSNIAMRRKGSG